MKHRIRGGKGSAAEDDRDGVEAPRDGDQASTMSGGGVVVQSGAREVMTRCLAARFTCEPHVDPFPQRLTRSSVSPDGSYCTYRVSSELWDAQTAMTD